MKRLLVPNDIGFTKPSDVNLAVLVMVIQSDLAVYGGEAIRSKAFPPRVLFGLKELYAVISVFIHSWQTGIDFGYEGKFEKAYTDAFCSFQGGGFADAVSSGTAAIYISLAALDLPTGSEVICSPVTDPGGITPIVALGFKPVIADSEPGTFNIGIEEFQHCITDKTSAVVVTHVGGIPAKIDRIVEICRCLNIRVVEDCSQAHGALIGNDLVGTIGDIAAFSTMYSKAHASGGCGGIVYTRNYDLYKRSRSVSDRGKAFFRDTFDPKNPIDFLFPSLNFNQDEISCAIGRETLRKLPGIIRRRNSIISRVSHGLRDCKSVSLLRCDNSIMSPFFMTIKINPKVLSVTKQEFANAVEKEGILVNKHYKYIVEEWDWLLPYMNQRNETPNARELRDSSFNVLFHEAFTEEDADSIIKAIVKVEKAFLR